VESFVQSRVSFELAPNRAFDPAECGAAMNALRGPSTVMNKNIQKI
jgi:hypothetical protein